MAKQSFEDVMNNLKEVPGVKEHLNKHSVIMCKEIFKRRLVDWKVSKPI